MSATTTAAASAEEQTFTCCLCRRESQGHGHNPAPLAKKGRCCRGCNAITVFARMGSQMSGQPINRLAWVARIRSDWDHPDLVRIRAMFGG